MSRLLSTDNQIGAYIHCARCLKERPHDVTPRDWAQLEIGWTNIGLQVWCKRHECNVLHIDFEGCKHPADTSIPGASHEPRH